ncbi:MAG: hypothetical protein UW87_C0001G0010 [Candidatus Moranbacteria bacterium GW2011_GWC2_45_10]|nr:MAG: hypothetical protein UW87_C0001G0010 [Candidatus Moranbacteria bacterium GW2011_GWC2_45_10]
MLLFVIGSVAAIYVIYVAGKEAYRGRKIEKEIEALRQEAEQIRAENGGLQEKISYFDTNEFREKIAKEKLNLKKEDEKVVEIRPVAMIKGDQAEAPEQPTAPSPEIKNYRKWWNRFFNLQEKH